MTPTRAPVQSRLNVSDEFGYWLSGLFDGEGCFLFKDTHNGVTAMVPKFKIVLRADDREVIGYIHQHLGCGKIYTNEYKSENYKSHRPWADFRVTKIADLAEVIVPLFDRYPLRTKKAKEFMIWRAIVLKRYENQGRPISPDEKEVYERVNEWVTNLRSR